MIEKESDHVNKLANLFFLLSRRQNLVYEKTIYEVRNRKINSSDEDD